MNWILWLQGKRNSLQSVFVGGNSCSVRLVASVRRKDLVNDQLLKLTWMKFERLLSAVREYNKCPAIKCARIGRAQNFPNSVQNIKLQIKSAATCNSESKTKQFASWSSVTSEPEQSACMIEAKRNYLKVNVFWAVSKQKVPWPFSFAESRVTGMAHMDTVEKLLIPIYFWKNVLMTCYSSKTEPLNIFTSHTRTSCIEKFHKNSYAKSNI